MSKYKYRDTRRRQLYVKAVSLGDEIVTIKNAESMTRGTTTVQVPERRWVDDAGVEHVEEAYVGVDYYGDRDMQDYQELREHRLSLGQAARYAHLAQAFFSGFDYSMIENTCALNNVPVFGRVRHNVHKFGLRVRGADYEQQVIDLEEWITEAQEHVRSQSQIHGYRLLVQERVYLLRGRQSA